MKFLRSSLYLKLFTIYSITFLLIMFALAIAVKKSRPVSIENSIRNNVHNYAQYIARDIGTPPDLKKAEQIQKETRLDIAITGPGVEWSNDEKLLSIAKTRLHNKRKHGFVVEENGYTFVYGTRNLKEPGLHWEIVIGFVFVFILILVLSYRTVKFVMKPIMAMKDAADAYGEGKWETRIDVKSHDELGDLGHTMNSMAKKIDSHFKNMKDLLLAISHELRSPLTRMRVTTEFISDEKIKNSLNEEINTLDRITGMLLERERLSTKPELLEKREVSLSEIVKSVAGKFQNIELHLPIHEIILVDVNRFELALNSIIDNAFKHGRPPVIISTGATHDLIWLEVKDHGEGIPEVHTEKLGEPFFKQSEARTSSRSSDGFGLGLSLAYSILKAHGFHLSAKANQGTTFRIEMPRALSLKGPIR